MDGKQRLNSIAVFLRSELKLCERYLEYYGDLYADKTFIELSNEFSTEMDDFASQTLDIYVITSSSPESTKYDIFSRLNKGSAPLRVNEIRKAVYHSPLITEIDAFIRDEQKNDNERYCNLFSKAKIERYEDYGIFYKAIAFYLSVDEENLVVKGYNSRPRELINVNDTLRMYKNDDIRMYNSDCITDTIVEVITTCNTYTLLTVHLL